MGADSLSLLTLHPSASSVFPPSLHPSPPLLCPALLLPFLPLNSTLSPDAVDGENTCTHAHTQFLITIRLLAGTSF